MIYNKQPKTTCNKKKDVPYTKEQHCIYYNLQKRYITHNKEDDANATQKMMHLQQIKWCELQHHTYSKEDDVLVIKKMTCLQQRRQCTSKKITCVAQKQQCAWSKEDNVQQRWCTLHKKKMKWGRRE